jgi:hypothetical protein
MIRKASAFGGGLNMLRHISFDLPQPDPIAIALSTIGSDQKICGTGINVIF